MITIGIDHPLISPAEALRGKGDKDHLGVDPATIGRTDHLDQPAANRGSF